jgi:hypothetical protein
MMAFITRNQHSLLRHLKARGILTILWSVNTDEEFLEILDNYGGCETIGRKSFFGCCRTSEFLLDGVMTDYPSRLNSFITKYEKEYHLQ